MCHLKRGSATPADTPAVACAFTQRCMAEGAAGEQLWAKEATCCVCGGGVLASSERERLGEGPRQWVRVGQSAPALRAGASLRATIRRCRC